MLKSKYYTENELSDFGFKKIGKNVKISSDARIYGQENISLGNNVRIDDFVILSATNGFIEIGNNVFIARGCHLSGFFGIILKNFSTMAANSIIYSASDDYSGNVLTGQAIPQEYTSHAGGLVTIGKHVIIGTSCVIIGGCDIGDGCSVGSMSFVIRDLEEWNVYAGIPAKILKKRSNKLLDLEKKLISDRPEFG
ncbi:acyltransferase [Gelidibacter japonicus]|uniref:acyltransferase n=1 Tax=Gelidibacter japonicus TaxID=1962232 RepID=UPI003A9095EA